MKNKLFIALGLSALAFTGCETASNTNVNMRNVNNNTAVVVNNNSDVVTNTRRDNTNISREEYDKNRAEYEKDRGTSTIGQGVNDSWLWFKTRAALLAEDDLRESTVNVDVANDVVTLKGTVATAGQKKRAEEVAKSIEGVKSVKNDLQVKPLDSMTNQMVNGNTNTHANTNKK